MENYESVALTIFQAMAMGAIGLIGWLVKRTFSHTIPRLAGDFKEALSEQAKNFKDTLEKQAADFKEELEFQREEIRAQRAEFREELRAQREDFKIELQKLGERIDELAEAVRELSREGA